MKKHTQLAKTLWATFIILASLALIFQAVAVLTDMESGENYYQVGAIFPVLALISALLGAACGTLAAILTPSPAAETSPFSSHTLITPTAIGFLFSGISLLIHVATVPDPKQILPHPAFAIVVGCLLLLAAPYTVLCDLKHMRTKADLLVFLGFPTVIGSILINAYYYFDLTVEMNAPQKVALQMALLFMMLSFAGELRYLLGSPRTRMYIIVNAWSIALGAIASLPVILTYAIGSLPRIDYLGGAVLILLFTVAQSIRLWRVLRVSPIEETTELETEGTPETDIEEEGRN